LHEVVSGRALVNNSLTRRAYGLRRSWSSKK
jgi:hypothetical protein